MKLEWCVSLTIVFHFFSKSTSEFISPEYERLLTLPSSELYQACLEENFQNCDLFNNEDIVKRSPKFNSWGGKRAQFSSWGGKRAPQFSSWGGKRAPQFSSWGGKRNPQFSSELFDESSDLEKRAKFSNWGGKRNSLNDEKRAKFSNWGGKRAKFSNWGGKRMPSFYYEDSFGKRGDSLGYKRKPAFSSWGGKRSGTVEQFSNEEEEDSVENGHVMKKREASEETNFAKNQVTVENGHVMKKREAAEETNFADNQVTDMWKEFFDRISNPNFNKNNPISRERPSEIAPGPSSTRRPPMTKKSPAPDPQIQRLFKQFVFWSNNRPESKKNELSSSFLKDLNMGNPVRRGNLDFYAWGGKRSETIIQ